MRNKLNRQKLAQSLMLRFDKQVKICVIDRGTEQQDVWLIVEAGNQKTQQKKRRQTLDINVKCEMSELKLIITIKEKYSCGFCVTILKEHFMLFYSIIVSPQ